ncbi:PAS domain-containing protein [Algibacillus agarilyticus]|uniref:PAS domain-containing protein n=1 Tax=Algibacillus agarilyticus TaxID=2234133 RepID=UPI000DCF9774|nr:PAS domain-containing protein [Algibacillus agarilyticus]
MSNNLDQAHYLKEELYTLIQNDPLIFDFLQQSTLDGLWYWDLNEPEHEWMNPQFWLLLGYDPEEMPHLAAAWQDIIFADDLRLASHNFQQHLNDPNHPYDQIVRYRHKDGSTVWVRCRGIAIHDQHGKPFRMLGAHNDYTLLMEKQQDALKTKLDISQTQNDVIHLKNENRELSIKQEGIMHQLKTGELINSLELIHPPGAFLNLIQQHSKLSVKLNTPLTFVILSIKNMPHIESSLGSEIGIEILNIIARMLHSFFDTAIIRRFVNSELILADIGVEAIETASILQALSHEITAYRWLSITPQISLRVNHYNLTAQLKTQSSVDDLIMQTHQDGQHIL